MLNAQSRNSYRKERKLLSLNSLIAKEDDLATSEWNALPSAIWTLLGTVGIWVILICFQFLHAALHMIHPSIIRTMSFIKEASL
jgi:hypothetical protein